MPIFWAGIWPPPPAWANANPAASSIAAANAENVTRFICRLLRKSPEEAGIILRGWLRGRRCGDCSRRCRPGPRRRPRVIRRHAQRDDPEADGAVDRLEQEPVDDDRHRRE